MKHGEVYDRKGIKVVIASCDVLNDSADPTHRPLTVPVYRPPRGKHKIFGVPTQEFDPVSGFVSVGEVEPVNPTILYTRVGMMTGATMAGIAAKLRGVFVSD
jgi:mRNA-degrading endonuclease toxin of MazEF toxin-antitoxin module